MARHPDYTELYFHDPKDGIVKQTLVHTIDAHDAVLRFPKEYSLQPPKDGRFAVVRTPQLAAMGPVDENERREEILKHQEDQNRASADRQAEQHRAASMASWSGRDDQRDTAVRDNAAREGIDPTRPDLHETAFQRAEANKSDGKSGKSGKSDTKSDNPLDKKLGADVGGPRLENDLAPGLKKKSDKDV